MKNRKKLIVPCHKCGKGVWHESERCPWCYTYMPTSPDWFWKMMAVIAVISAIATGWQLL